MKPIVVSDILAVGEFPTLDEIVILARAGFKSIINNQPDGEVARFPASAVVAEAARAAGLAHAYAPISSRTPDAAELAAFANALEALPAPIYAFCYSGARSAAAAALLRARACEPDALIREFAEAGIDIRALEPWLCEANARHKGSATGLAPPPDAASPREPGRPTQSDASSRPLPGIVVYAHPRGAGGFAMIDHAH